MTRFTLKTQQSNSPDSTSRKSRAKYRCTPELEKYLQINRLIPPDAELLDPEKAFNRNKVENQIEGKGWKLKDGYLRTLRATYKECIEPRPVTFQLHITNRANIGALGYLNRNDHEEIWYRQALNIYSSFLEDREHLKQYTRAATNRRKEGHATFGAGGMFNAEGINVNFPSPLSGYTEEYTKEGLRTTVEPIGVSAALHNVISDRVRFCEVCSNIFWATRKDAEACSPQCANTMRVRLSRNLSEEEKARRRATRKSNRDLVRNGTAKSLKRKK